MSAGRVEYMGIVNLSPDSLFGRAGDDIAGRVEHLLAQGADILDFGAVSTRPGAEAVSVEQEWARLEPALKYLDSSRPGCAISIDTASSEIVRRVFDTLGRFIVNDVSAGESDPAMLDTVRELGLKYIAMHRRGNPETMDSMQDYSEFATRQYPSGVIPALIDYFTDFSRRADGIDWILDPGLGFAKTREQNWEILRHLDALSVFGRRILVSASDKRFTCGRTDLAERLAVQHGAGILRVHVLPQRNPAIEPEL